MQLLPKVLVLNFKREPVIEEKYIVIGQSSRTIVFCFLLKSEFPSSIVKPPKALLQWTFQAKPIEWETVLKCKDIVIVVDKWIPI